MAYLNESGLTILANWVKTIFARKDELSTAATSGDYNDLENTPNEATENESGLMSAADKAKLDGIEEGATRTDEDTDTKYTLVMGDDVEGGHVVRLEGTDNSVVEVVVPDANDNDNTEYDPATSEVDGLMSAQDKAKLDGIEAGAQANAVTGVKGQVEAAYRIGMVTITKDDIGLPYVDNTADIDKRVAYAEEAGNAAAVAGHTVGIDVPEDALFTDTTYGLATSRSDGLMPKEAFEKLSFVEDYATACKGTVRKVEGAVGLTGTVTDMGTIKASLAYETPLTRAATRAAEMDGRVYPVAIDANGNLAVNVPWVGGGGGDGAVSGVKGDAEEEYRTGMVNITKYDIGLGNVDDTSDADKPVSDAVQVALDALSDEISAAITSVFRYKGVKANASQLPESGDVGDVWHVSEDSGEYVWDGAEWEALGNLVDLSGYLTDIELAGRVIDASNPILSQAELTSLISMATTSSDGLMSSADKGKLDSVPSEVPSSSDIAAMYQGKIFISPCTIYASGWNSATGMYNGLERSYPASEWNMLLSPSDSTTDDMIDVWGNAKIVGARESNALIAHGEVPSIDVQMMVMLMPVSDDGVKLANGELF